MKTGRDRMEEIFAAFDDARGEAMRLADAFDMENASLRAVAGAAQEQLRDVLKTATVLRHTAPALVQATAFSAALSTPVAFDEGAALIEARDRERQQRAEAYKARLYTRPCAGGCGRDHTGRKFQVLCPTCKRRDILERLEKARAGRAVKIAQRRAGGGL